MISGIRVAAWVVALLVAQAAAGARLDTLFQGSQFEAASLARTPAGEWAVVYGEHELRYAVFDGAAWTFEVASTDGCIHHMSLAFDGANPLIAYSDGALKLARFDGAAWQVEVIDASTDIAGEVSLAVGTAGELAISYYDVAGFDLELARWDGANWTLETVDASSAGTGARSSISIAPTGLLAISYCAIFCEELRVAREDAPGSWQFDVVETGPRVPFTKTALAHVSGGLALAYGRQSGATAGMYVAEFDGATWSVFPLGTVRSTLPGVGLEVRSTGERVVGWQADDGTLQVARGQGMTWTFETGLTETRPLEGFGFTIDESEVPAFAYSLQSTFARLATTDGIVWTGHDIERMAGAAARVAIAIDATGAPAVAFDPDLLRDKIDRWDGSQWVETEITDPDIFGAHALGFDPTGAPVLVHERSGELRYSTFDGALWVTEMVAPVTALANRRVSLRFDGAGRAVIAARVGQELWVARRDVGWTIDVIRTDAGSNPGLVIDPSGEPAVVFHDTASVLLLARTDGAMWNVEVVPVATTSGTSAGVAFAPSGRPAVAFADFETIEYAEFDGAVWSPQVVIDSPRPRDAVELAFDPAGAPVVAYVGWRGVLEQKLARRDGGWQVTTIESGYRGGGFTGTTALRMALLADGTPVVAYHSNCEREVRVWWGDPAGGVAPDLHRGLVAGLGPGWRAAALPLTDLNDDETAPFPIATDYTRVEPDCTPGPTLSLYRYLEGGTPVGNGLRAVSGAACADDGVTVSFEP